MSFITVKEGVELTGKALSTIFKFCKANKDSQYVKQRKKGLKSIEYLIDKDFLLSKYPKITSKNDADLEELKKQLEEALLENKDLKRQLKEKDFLQDQFAKVVDSNQLLSATILRIAEKASLDSNEVQAILLDKDDSNK